VSPQLKRKIFSVLVFVAVVLLVAVLSYYGLVIPPSQPTPTGPTCGYVNSRHDCVQTPTLTQNFRRGRRRIAETKRGPSPAPAAGRALRTAE
jgi:hypothetical protein